MALAYWISALRIERRRAGLANLRSCFYVEVLSGGIVSLAKAGLFFLFVTKMNMFRASCLVNVNNLIDSTFVTSINSATFSLKYSFSLLFRINKTSVLPLNSRYFGFRGIKSAQIHKSELKSLLRQQHLREQRPAAKLNISQVILISPKPFSRHLVFIPSFIGLLAKSYTCSGKQNDFATEWQLFPLV